MVYLFCGKKGTDKTLYTVSYLLKNLNNYDYIFTNFPINFVCTIDNINWVKKIS